MNNSLADTRNPSQGLAWSNTKTQDKVAHFGGHAQRFPGIGALPIFSSIWVVLPSDSCGQTRYSYIFF